MSAEQQLLARLAQIVSDIRSDHEIGRLTAAHLTTACAVCSRAIVVVRLSGLPRSDDVARALGELGEGLSRARQTLASHGRLETGLLDEAVYAAEGCRDAITAATAEARARAH